MRARPYPSLPAGPQGGAPLLCGGAPPSADGEGRRRTVQTPTGRQRLARLGSDGGTLVGAASTAGSAEGERVGPRHAGLERAGLERAELERAEPGHTEFGVAPGAPIFVDATGRRRKVARRVSLAVVAVLAGYAGLLAVSFAGGPIPPKALLPVPGIPSGKAQTPVSSVNAAPSAPGKTAGHAAGQSSAGGTDQRGGTRGTKPGGSPGQSAPSEPSPTAASSVAPPSPTGTTTGTTSGNTRGNPTPPGHTRHKTPAPSQTS